MKTIPLTQGKVAIVDDCDYKYLIQWKWCYANGYATRGVRHPNRRTILMHREVLRKHGIESEQCDHIDSNRSNNVLSNLRPATHQQNLCNRGPQKNNTSGYKGVGKVPGGWRAWIWSDGMAYHSKKYLTPKEAAVIYNKAARNLHGEFAYQNVIPPQSTDSHQED